jgi:hypothetical protein
MPTYIYSKDGVQVEFFARMGCAPQSVFCNGTLYARDIAAEHGGQRSGDAWEDHDSLALSVHPLDVRKYQEDAKQKGVKVTFKKNGRVHFDSAKDHKAYLRAYGYVDFASYY